MKNSIDFVVTNNLCISCGLCKNLCPKSCITYKRDNGLFLPNVENTKCIDCGLCATVCPGINMSFEHSEPIYAVYGNIISCYNAWSTNDEYRHCSASGGVVSTIIAKLLKENMYDSAFVVDTYDYSSQLFTKRITKKDLDGKFLFSNVAKSRYLPVSHENLISYIKDNKNERIIIVGTSCALQGITKALKLLHLDRNKYLLIGLFCDKVYNYNIYQYYNDNFACNKNLVSLHFKNKESGGWPGNMKLFFDDGTYEYLDKSERIKTKAYFMPERCLYCIDKLNVNADISLGDNYTNINSSSKGSNSVIVRTELGKLIWKILVGDVEYHPVNIKDIHLAQYLDSRINNLYYAKLKMKKCNKKSQNLIDLSSGIHCEDNILEYEFAWKENVQNLKLGSIYNIKRIKKRMINKTNFFRKVRCYFYTIKLKLLSLIYRF